MPPRAKDLDVVAASTRFAYQLPHWGWFLLLAVVIGVGGAALRIGMAIYRQHVARETIERAGGSFRTERNGPQWLCDWLEENDIGAVEWFDDVVAVDLRSESVIDADLLPLSALSRLRELDLEGTHVTDAGMKYLSGLTELESLNLRDTRITEAGLVHLRRMGCLERLKLPACKLTENGMALLTRLAGLKEVTLYGGGPLDDKIVDIAEARGFDLMRMADVELETSTRQTLRGRKKVTLVYCHVPKELQWDNEGINYDLAKRVAYRLAQDKIRVVDPEVLYSWLDENFDWQQTWEIGKHFEVDYVVHIDVSNYTLFEANSANLYRGRADCRIHVVKMNDLKDHGRVIYSREIDSVYPIDAAVDARSIAMSGFMKTFLTVVTDEIASQLCSVSTGVATRKGDRQPQVSEVDSPGSRNSE